MVLKKETKDLMGESRDYLTINILHNNMTVMVRVRTLTEPGSAGSSTRKP